MTTVTDIISKWPSASEMARDLGLRPGHGAMMKMRKSIPVGYWPSLVDAAGRRGFDGVTLEALTSAHADQARRQPSASREGAAA